MWLFFEFLIWLIILKNYISDKKYLSYDYQKIKIINLKYRTLLIFKIYSSSKFISGSFSKTFFSKIDLAFI